MFTEKTTEDADESPFTFPVDCFVHAVVGEGGGPGGFKKIMVFENRVFL